MEKDKILSVSFIQVLRCVKDLISQILQKKNLTAMLNFYQH